MLPRLSSALVVLGLALLTSACAPEPRRPPNVLIVVIDTLRADRLGVYGNPRGLTPFLDGLAPRATLFERAYAPSSWTVPSVASLFTSRYPTQHHVDTFRSHLADPEVTLAERLRDAGWIVGGFSANPNLRTDRGFAQGFDELWTDLTPDVDVSGDTVRAHAIAWLDQTRDRHPQAPVALYLQYMEPHEPYAPREPFRSRFALDDDGKPFDLERTVRDLIEGMFPGDTYDEAGKPVDLATAMKRFLAHSPTPDAVLPVTQVMTKMNPRLYDGDVAAADDQVRRLFVELEAHGFLRDDTVVIVTSDHGEEFMEHGHTSHGRTLYEESVRVPLMLIGPGVSRGRRVTERVSLVDLAPTLLDLLGLPAEPRFEGRSVLREAPDSDATPDILLQLEPVLSGIHDNRIHERAIIHDDDKLIFRRHGGSEVYQLALDPHEGRSRPPDQGAALAERLSLTEGVLAGRAGTAAFAPIDEATKARLRALGYAP